jgi:hypothetical protein
MKTEGNHFALSNKAQGADGTGGSVSSSSEPRRREHVVVDIFTRTSSAPPTLTLAMASLAKVEKDPVHPPATAPAGMCVCVCVVCKRVCERERGRERERECVHRTHINTSHSTHP